MSRKSIITVLLFVALFTVATAYARGVLYTVGGGTSQGSDRSEVKTEAREQAETQATAACPGTVTDIAVTSSSCMSVGSNYICTVTVKARCEF